MPERLELEGSSREFARLYSPPRLRAGLGALIEIEREVRAALRPGLDHSVAHVRLTWWREECERCASGRALHPATRALLAAAGGPVDPRGLVATATWDLAAATFDTRAELTGYCERWASAMTETAARIAACATPDGRDGGETYASFGRALGISVCELELLGALAADARAGRLRLPLEELEHSGLEPSALARPEWPAALCRLVSQRHRAARSALAASVEALPEREQPGLRGLIVWAALAHRASRRAERALRAAEAPSDTGRPLGGSGALPRAGRASRIADGWHAWRAALRADRGTFHLRPEELP